MDEFFGKVKRWDRADCWLVTAFVAFVVTLWFEIRYPESIYAQAAHFVAEAALVGGIADWFAVTAIFEHPWGLKIPNTAILPSKRKTFANGAAAFVKGLLSEETLVKEIRGMNILETISSKLKESERREVIISYLLDLVRDRLDQMNRDKNVREVAGVIRQQLLEYRTKDLLKQGIKWLRTDNNGALALAWVAPMLKKEANSSEFCCMLKESYSELRDKEVTGVASFFVSVLETVNVVNLDDAVDVTQDELVKFASELGECDSFAQKKVLNLFFDKTDEILRDERLLKSLDSFRRNVIQEMPLEEALREVFSKLWRNFREEESRRRISEHTERAIRSHIADVLRNQLYLVLDLLRKDYKLQEDLDKFLKGVASTFAKDVARPKVAKIVKKVLDNMEDEQLNEIVRSKVKEDLMFIRINGVIVGGGIGFILFVGMQIINYITICS